MNGLGQRTGSPGLPAAKVIDGAGGQAPIGTMVHRPWLAPLAQHQEHAGGKGQRERLPAVGWDEVRRGQGGGESGARAAQRRDIGSTNMLLPVRRETAKRASGWISHQAAIRATELLTEKASARGHRNRRPRTKAPAPQIKMSPNFKDIRRSRKVGSATITCAVAWRN